MLKTLGKIGILILIAFIGAWFIRTIINIPYAWVTDRMYVRQHQLEHKSNFYNTIFVGSSKTFRGIKPNVFDKNVQKRDKPNIHSLNFGLGGATLGQIYGLTRHLIDNEELKVKNIFFELRTLQTSLQEKAFVKNLHTKRAVIWMYDWQALKFSVRSLWGINDSKFPFFTKIRYTAYFFIKYIDYKLNIGMVTDMLNRKLTSPNYSELGKRGYAPIDYDPAPGIKRLRKKFKKKADNIVKHAKKESIRTFGASLIPNDIHNNEALVQELKGLINYAKSKKIRLIFVAYPMLKAHDYKLLKPIFDRLPSKNKINLTNGAKYPALYKVENCWDDTHTNNKGAHILSEKLAIEFVKLLDKNKNNRSKMKKQVNKNKSK